jgi:hypothetical protein
MTYSLDFLSVALKEWKKCGATIKQQFKKKNRIANSDSTISSQSIYYSLSKNIISKIQTTNKDGVSSEIEFKYCSSCSLKRPEAITTTTNMKTDTLTMTIRILSFSSPAFIPPTLFEIE